MSKSSRPDFRDDDLQLLQSGNFADGTIKCKGRTWKVHRALLASRLKFFKAAFYGSFAEALSGEVDFPESDPGMVDIMLRYLYGEDIYVKDLKTPLLCVRCWKLANYVQLPTLEDAAMLALGDHFSAMALLASNSSEPEESKPQWSKHFFDAFQEVCSDTTTKKLRTTFSSFLWVTRFEILRQPQTLELLKQHPALNKNFLFILVWNEFKERPRWLPATNITDRAVKMRGDITFHTEVTCCKCMKKSKSSEETMFYNPFPVGAWRIGQLMWCKRCVDTFNEERSWPWRNDGSSKRDKLKIEAWSWSDEK